MGHSYAFRCLKVVDDTTGAVTTWVEATPRQPDMETRQ